MVKIKSVIPSSQAAKSGVQPGDTLLSIDGNPIADILDYRFYITESRPTLLFSRGASGEQYTAAFKKNRYDDIGLEFETYLMDKQRSCANNCVFCFIDQLPAGMRESLYFKDDDVRLSFLHGNYATLTNLTEHDIERVIKYRISPINVSVHTTNPDLRCEMMGNKNAGRVLGYLSMLKEGGITINAQVVVCKGINDGEELDRTLHTLYALYPELGSVSIVPAGITRHRDNCPPLEDFSREDARTLIEQVRTYSEGCMKLHGSQIFYLADELFIRAGVPIPDYEYYGEFQQIDNGVGLIAMLEREAADCLGMEQTDESVRRGISIATGYAAYDCISGIAQWVRDKFPNVNIRVHRIANRFFGETVTVAGLICGCDLIEQLMPYRDDLGEQLLIPSAMLRHEGDMFLDSITLAEASRRLNINITPVENDGFKLVDAIIGK